MRWKTFLLDFLFLNISIQKLTFPIKAFRSLAAWFWKRVLYMRLYCIRFIWFLTLTILFFLLDCFCYWSLCRQVFGYGIWTIYFWVSRVTIEDLKVSYGYLRNLCFAFHVLKVLEARILLLLRTRTLLHGLKERSWIWCLVYSWVFREW